MFELLGKKKIGKKKIGKKKNYNFRSNFLLNWAYVRILPFPPDAPIATVSPRVNNFASIIVLCISSSKA